MIACNYWIAVLSQDHAQRGVEGGFAQVNHGRAGPLERLKAGDGFAVYSPRAAHPSGAPLQAFTAIGRVRTGLVYQVEVSDDFHPFRIDIEYLPASPAPIRPLIETLAFLRSKTHWGAAFRFGFLRVPAADFARIAAAMGGEAGREFAQPADLDSQPAHADGQTAAPPS